MNDNFGDFLLYDQTCDAIKATSPLSEVFSYNVSASYDDLTNVKRVKANEIVPKMDIAILTGGGYFGQPDKRKQCWNYRFITTHGRVLSQIAASKKPYMVVGLGVGPLSWRRSREIAKEVLGKANKVILRDNESAEFAHEMGVNRTIKVLPDLVMGCRIEKYLTQIDWAVSQWSSNQSRRVIIHLVSKNRGELSGIGAVINDVISVANDPNSSMEFAIVTDHTNNKFLKRAYDIAEALGQAKNRVFPYENPQRLVSLISTADLVITDKLHVGIVATKLRKPVISVPWHSKTSRFYKQMGLSRCCVPLNEVRPGCVKRMLTAPVLDEMIIGACEATEELSAHNFDAISSFISSYDLQQS